MRRLESLSLEAGYRGRVVLRGVELEFSGGEFVAVLGPNASGKSTLLKTLAGLLKPLGGVVLLEGREMRAWRRGEVAKRIGVVLTEPVNPGLMTVYDVVSLGRYSYTGVLAELSEADREAIKNSLLTVGVLGLAGRRFSELSDGERQKVMIARALAQEPRVMILDEPTTHLDALSRVEVLLLLRRLAREMGITVIASMHDVELAIRLADRLIIVERGGIRAVEQVEGFVARGGISELYGINGSAYFDKVLYTIEPHYPSGAGMRIHVVAGAGSGAPIYRALKKMGIRTSTGVLHENDVDFYVARSLGLEVASERPYEEISDDAYAAALGYIERSDAVVDASPPIGWMNRRNLQLLSEALGMGKPLIKAGREIEDLIVEVTKIFTRRGEIEVTADPPSAGSISRGTSDSPRAPK